MSKVVDKPMLREDAALALARHAVTLPYEFLSSQVVGLTKQCVLDTLGVILGASTLAPEARVVVDFVKNLGGTEESTILGFGGKAPAPWAAFANGSLGHMLDYDDLSAAAGGHRSVTTVPVAFAVAEKLGGVTGRDLLAAIAIGIDIQARLHLAIPTSEWTMTEGWFATQLLGFFSGTATAGRLLGLNEKEMVNAFGIAFTQVSGSREMAVDTATHIRGMQGGFTGQGSILAALLAGQGITGSKNSLEGRYGLYEVYLHTQPDRDALLSGLGTRFPALEDHAFKAWPACGATRAIVGAVLDLRESHGLHAEDLEELVIVGGDGHTRLLSEPLESKRRPKISMDAKYSIPFTAAVAMAKGNVTLGAYTDDGLNDPEVLAMAKHVRHLLVSDKEKTSSIPIVEVRTRDGRTFRKQVKHPLGDSENPMSPDQLEAKFRDCVSFSVRSIPHENIEQVIKLVGQLEMLDDATQVIRLLTEPDCTGLKTRR